MERGHNPNCGNSDVIMALVEMEHPNLAAAGGGISKSAGGMDSLLRSIGRRRKRGGHSGGGTADRDAKSSIQRRRDAGRTSAVIR